MKKLALAALAVLALAGCESTGMKLGGGTNNTVTGASTVVKVDDTGVGIAEGLNAGCWTVGVAISGNANGLSLPEWQALPPAEQAAVRISATRQLQDAGAHFVIDSVADLLPVIAQITEHLQKQELPARAA